MIMDFFRAVFVLFLAPVSTFAISILALVMHFVFKAKDKTIQIVPRTWAKMIVFCSGVKVTVSGGEKLEDDKPYIFAANHQSQFDIFTLQGFLNRDFRWMAKKELFQIPVFGRAMIGAGYISVDRSRGRKALKSLYEAAERIASGTSVIIFPEGTRSPDGNLLPFKSGAMVLAIKAGVPIVPVAIAGTHEILPKGKLLLRSGEVTITIGEPIATNNFQQGQKQELAQYLHDKIASLLGEHAG